MTQERKFYHVGENEPVMDVDGLVIRESQVITYSDGREILLAPKYSNGGEAARKIEVPGFIKNYKGTEEKGIKITTVKPISSNEREEVKRLVEQKGLEGQVEFW